MAQHCSRRCLPSTLESLTLVTWQLGSRERSIRLSSPTADRFPGSGSRGPAHAQQSSYLTKQFLGRWCAQLTSDADQCRHHSVLRSVAAGMLEDVITGIGEEPRRRCWRHSVSDATAGPGRGRRSGPESRAASCRSPRGVEVRGIHRRLDCGAAEISVWDIAGRSDPPPACSAAHAPDPTPLRPGWYWDSWRAPAGRALAEVESATCRRASLHWRCLPAGRPPPARLRLTCLPCGVHAGQGDARPGRPAVRQGAVHPHLGQVANIRPARVWNLPRDPGKTGAWGAGWDQGSQAGMASGGGWRRHAWSGTGAWATQKLLVAALVEPLRRRHPALLLTVGLRRLPLPEPAQKLPRDQGL